MWNFKAFEKKTKKFFVEILNAFLDMLHKKIVCFFACERKEKIRKKYREKHEKNVYKREKMCYTIFKL